MDAPNTHFLIITQGLTRLARAMAHRLLPKNPGESFGPAEREPRCGRAAEELPPTVHAYLSRH